MIDGRSYLSQLFGMAFGVSSPVFVPYTVNVDRLFFKETAGFEPKLGQNTPLDLGFKDLRMKMEQEAEAVSWMGTPIVYPFTFKGQPDYKVYRKDGQLENKAMADFMLPAATLVDFTRAKNIIKTPISGGNGSVKELYSFDDWRIRVRGICLDDNTRKTAPTAKEQKEQLLIWERIAGSIEVTGALFIEKNIKAVTINSANFTQLQGQPGVIPFELECESDERIELIL